MKRLKFSCIVLTITLLFTSSCNFTDTSSSTPQNVFEEIYYDMVQGCNMIDRVSSLMYSKSWETGGTPWQNNNFGYIRYEGISDGEVCIYATKNEPTITFVYVVSKRAQEAYYSYRYSLKTKELTYSTNDYEMKEVDSFLFNVVLVDWYNSNLPNNEQIYQTSFSPDNWGEYVLVTPYQLS